MKLFPIACLCAVLSATPRLRAGDSWTQFRGPTAQGFSDAKGLACQWSETEHVKWKTPLPGEGWSSPVVANGQAWMTTALEEGKSVRALCVDFASGSSSSRDDSSSTRDGRAPRRFEIRACQKTVRPSLSLIDSGR